MKKAQSRKIDLILVIIWPIIASLLTFYFKFNLFESTLLYLGIPAAYISYKHPKFIIKSVLFAISAVPLLIILDYLAVTTGTWYFKTSILPGRLFGVVTFEVIFWYALYAYFIVIFYEYFLDHKCTYKLPDKKVKYPLVFIAFLFVIFCLTVVTTGSFIIIPYIYLWIGVFLCAIPLLAVLFEFPNLFTKFAEMTVYFFFFGLAWELTAVPLEQWSFPGNYFIGWITLMGVTFPFEEMFVWMVLSTGGLLSWYEFFDDDRK